MSTIGTTPPGWYVDPYYPGSMRYWDGQAWTPHAQVVSMAPAHPTEVLDLERGRVAADRASMAAFVLATCQSAVALIYAEAFGSAFRNLDQADAGVATPAPVHFSGWVFLAQPLGIVAIVCQVLVMLWCYRATANARALGRPTTHTPAMAAVGWIIPILNFWYPYQAVRDLLPPDDPARGKVGVWWGCYLGGGVLLLVPMVVGFFSTGIALATAVIPIVVMFVAAATLRRIIKAVSAAQRAAAAHGYREGLLSIPGSRR